MIFLIAEHRGYGDSITGGDQSIPAYISIKQVLLDFHRVVEYCKIRYSGPWIAAGYSYGGAVKLTAAIYNTEIKRIIVYCRGS